MVRHGERCDNSPAEDEKSRVELQWDPPLTQAGREQARLTGVHLLECLKRQNV